MSNGDEFTLVDAICAILYYDIQIQFDTPSGFFGLIPIHRKNKTLVVCVDTNLGTSDIVEHWIGAEEMIQKNRKKTLNAVLKICDDHPIGLEWIRKELGK